MSDEHVFFYRLNGCKTNKWLNLIEIPPHVSPTSPMFHLLHTYLPPPTYHQQVTSIHAQVSTTPTGHIDLHIDLQYWYN